MFTKPLAFPRRKKLGGFFLPDTFSLVFPNTKQETLKVDGSDGPLFIQTGGSITGKTFRSFRAIPNDKVVNWIAMNMLSIDYDTIYFEIVERADGTALILAKYNRIIGSRYLGLIPSSELSGV